MNPKEIEKSFTCCNNCNAQYDLYSFGGYLISQKNREFLNTFKTLLQAGDGSKIAKFITLQGNQLKIACLQCQTFAGWHIE